jgi:hypothetical protein
MVALGLHCLLATVYIHALIEFQQYVVDFYNLHLKTYFHFVNRKTTWWMCFLAWDILSMSSWSLKLNLHCEKIILVLQTEGSCSLISWSGIKISRLGTMDVWLKINSFTIYVLIITNNATFLNITQYRQQRDNMIFLLPVAQLGPLHETSIKFKYKWNTNLTVSIVHCIHFCLQESSLHSSYSCVHQTCHARYFIFHRYPYM